MDLEIEVVQTDNAEEVPKVKKKRISNSLKNQPKFSEISKKNSKQNLNKKECDLELIPGDVECSVIYHNEIDNENNRNETSVDTGSPSELVAANSCIMKNEKLDTTVYETSDNIEDTNIGDNDCLLMEEFYDQIVEEFDVWESINPCDEEEQQVKDFLSKECCKRKCNTKFKCEELLLYRLELQSIDYNEHGVNQLDLVLLGLIHSLCRISDEIRHSRTVKLLKRRRIKMMFAFRGVSVCRAMFMFAHSIKIERLKRLLKRYKHEGIAPKPHGNYQRVPANAITVEQTKDVVYFLRKYAKENAAVVPGRSSYFNQDIKILPPNETKVRIFNKYKQLCAQRKTACISVVSFRRLWNRYCPDIMIQRPENSNSQKNTSCSQAEDSDDSM